MGSLYLLHDRVVVVVQTKRTVFIQVVFIKVGEIDTVKETFAADVFIQARWREPRFDGRHKANTTVFSACSDSSV